MLFEFAPLGTGTIPPDGTSSLVYLTATLDGDQMLDIVWAETESPGGFGAAGDVVGIKNVGVPFAVPEPASIAVWCGMLLMIGGVRCVYRRAALGLS